jgi:hypothetical protein
VIVLIQNVGGKTRFAYARGVSVVEDVVMDCNLGSAVLLADSDRAKHATAGSDVRM